MLSVSLNKAFLSLSLSLLLFGFVFFGFWGGLCLAVFSTSSLFLF